MNPWGHRGLQQECVGHTTTDMEYEQIDFTIGGNNENL